MEAYHTEEEINIIGAKHPESEKPSKRITKTETLRSSLRLESVAEQSPTRKTFKEVLSNVSKISGHGKKT